VRPDTYLREGHMSFEIGDVVILKSGGLHMTVASVAAKDGIIWCQWHDANGKPRTWGYPAAALKESKL